MKVLQRGLPFAAPSSAQHPHVADIRLERRQALRRLRLLEANETALHQAADKRFAQANGWRVSKAFDLELLISGKQHGGWHSYNPLSTIFDHPNFFRADRRPVAIVAHNYPGAIEQLRAKIAAVEGLILHEPSTGGMQVSWYYPGGTLPMCITRPDVSAVVWPSEDDLIELVAVGKELKELHAMM
jgi:hypothetical protein